MKNGEYLYNNVFVRDGKQEADVLGGFVLGMIIDGSTSASSVIFAMTRLM
jgi:hypothetical protein